MLCCEKDELLGETAAQWKSLAEPLRYTRKLCNTSSHYEQADDVTFYTGSGENYPN